MRFVFEQKPRELSDLDVESLETLEFTGDLFFEGGLNLEIGNERVVVRGSVAIIPMMNIFA